MEGNRDRRISIALCFFLGVLTLLVFSCVVHHDFVDYDDQDYVTENSTVQAGLTLQGLRWAFAQPHAANWIPITWLSHMLDCQLFGLNPGWHHLTNLVLHTASTLLLFLLLQQMTAAIFPSAIVAALFALHPLHVESVAWVSERKDVLSVFFLMLTLWAYARYVEWSKSRNPKSKVWYGAALGFFALGLMSKPMLVTVPFLLLLLDYWPLNRFPIKNQTSRIQKVLPLLLEKTPFFALTILFSVITFFAQKQAGAMVLMESVPLKLRLANAAVSYVRYVLNTFWPTDLSAFYPLPPGWPVWLVVLALSVLLVVSGFVLRERTIRPYLVVGWFWFLGALFPVIGVVQVGLQSMADRYTYLPLIGVFIMVAFGAGEFMQRQPESRLGLGLVAAIITAFCAMLSVVQAGYWRNTATLFEHALAVTSDNALAEYSLGVARVKAGDYAEAYPHFAEAVRIKPDYGEAHNNLGLLLVMNGKTDEGIAHYRQALASKTDTPELHFNLACALFQKGALNEAADECRIALRAKPAFSTAGLKLATILANQGKVDDARHEYLEVLSTDPGNTEAHLAVGLADMQHAKPQQAIDHFVAALHNGPDARPHYYLALALSLAGRSDEALEHFHAAVNLQPAWPAALNDLAWMLATDPKPEHRNGVEAVRLAEKACELTQRKEPRCLGTLDACYAETGRFDEAIATAREAQALAARLGQQEITEAAAARCKLYELKQPYHQSPPSERR